MTELSIFEGSAVPAHVRAKFAVEANSDLSSGVSSGFPILSFKGKVWHVVEGENRTLVANEDGEPRSSIELVILKSNPHISKVFYRDGYEEGSAAKPTCYSHDGIVPAPDSEKISLKCAICPNNQWGSKTTELGAKGKACADSRRLAIAPSGELDRPMLLRVPAGSLKELVSYAEMLARRQTPYQAVVTKVSFDHTVAHQKLVFKPIRWLNEDEITKVAEVVGRDVVTTIVGNDQYGAAQAAVEPEIAGERPTHSMAQAPAVERSAVREAVKVTPAEVAAIVEPVVEPKPAPVATGFGGGEPKQAEPVVEQKPVSERVLLEEADGALARVLASLDD